MAFDRPTHSRTNGSGRGGPGKSDLDMDWRKRDTAEVSGDRNKERRDIGDGGGGGERGRSGRYGHDSPGQRDQKREDKDWRNHNTGSFNPLVHAGAGTVNEDNLKRRATGRIGSGLDLNERRRNIAGKTGDRTASGGRNELAGNWRARDISSKGLAAGFVGSHPVAEKISRRTQSAVHNINLTETSQLGHSPNGSCGTGQSPSVGVYETNESADTSSDKAEGSEFGEIKETTATTKRTETQRQMPEVSKSGAASGLSKPSTETHRKDRQYVEATIDKIASEKKASKEDTQPTDKAKEKLVDMNAMTTNPDKDQEHRGHSALRKGFKRSELQDADNPSNVLLHLSENTEGLTNRLNTFISPDMTRKLLQTINTVVENQDTDHRNDVINILQNVCTSRFLDEHLVIFVNQMTSAAVVDDIEMIQQLTTNVCHRFPSYAHKCTLLLSYILDKEKLIVTLQEKKPSVEGDLRVLVQDCERSTDRVQNRARTAAPRRRADPDDDDREPPADIGQMPIIPKESDLDWTQQPFLRPNKTVGAFRDQDHYLDVQFRLLREDFIRPIREGIKEYKQNGYKKRKEYGDLRMYYRVHILQVVCDDTLEHKLKFDATPMDRVNWYHSKRLTHGGLVCLTNDDFETPYFAVVTNRDPKDLEHGILQVRFENGLDDILVMKPGDTLTMAETPAFFEAYRHVLEALQEMAMTRLPMAGYIVGCRRYIVPPVYLRSENYNVELKLHSFLRDDSSFDASRVPALSLNDWPPLKETIFNDSQLEAIRTSLTKELAIIQGPPGTGKTFVGLKLAKVLLENKCIWSSLRDSRPILVVCYTNHALDQFLEGILRICPNGVIRVGSRGKNPAVERCNLKEVRRRENSYSSHEMQDCKTDLRELSKAIQRRIAQDECIKNGTVLGADDLYGQMLRGQYESLTDNCKEVFPPAVLQALTDDWLAFGSMMKVQNGWTDPYTLLAQEVTSLIISGSDTCAEKDIRPSEVHSLPFGTRAKLYRSWTSKMRNSLHSPCEEILPDEELRPLMNETLYRAITAPLLKQHEKEKKFCVRAWLGVQASSQEVINAIIKGDSSCNDIDIHPSSVGSLPRNVRVRLYRFWMKAYVNKLQLAAKMKKRKKKKRRIPPWVTRGLAEAKSGILADEALKGMLVVKKTVFAAIQDYMLQRHAQQKRYMIKAWLGIAKFARDPQVLEDVLFRLKGDSRDLPVVPQFAVNGNEDDNKDGVEEQHGSTQSDQFQPVGKGKRKTAKLCGPDDAWTIPDWLRQTRKKQVQQALREAKPMTEDEAATIFNLWDPELTLNDRVRLYLFWVQRHKPDMIGTLLKTRKLHEQKSKELQILRDKQDVEVLRKASVIGMTTTRAARYRNVLKEIACPIVILEEAAEVLEAHVVATLHESCQHLILIGDHQQLRPSPTVYDLCRRYHLDLSLFERLVNNKLHHTTLTVQHRMRPEVSRLIRHIYPHLKDHVTTLNRPHIRGMKEDVFLFDHEVFEQSHHETSSKYNDYEAEMVMRLCKYLLLQGYEPNNITILTAYTGQILKLKSIMQASMFQGVLVTSVDNYQGEENDVIILSLVRSNEEETVGFLGTDNRVCVALSRARNGLYAFGNFRILAKSKSPLWRKIVATATQHGQLGQAIVLRCENHPDTEIPVSKPRDFDGAPEGGCRLPCRVRLDCGHACHLVCHGYDRDHEQYQCTKHCERQVCEQNLHPCPKLCHEDCGQCVVRVEKTVPQCGHKAIMECSSDPRTWICRLSCEGTLACGHRCSSACGNCVRKGSHDVSCRVLVERTWPCGHLVQLHCHHTPDTAPCYIPCETKLDCGHLCPGTCGTCLGGRVHVPCKETCGEILKGCGHLCPLPCGTFCLPCKKKCGRKCKHEECDHDCGEPCEPCEESCPRKCRHWPCTATCDRQCQSCSEPCEVVLPCGHPCRGFCGEKCVCYICEKSRYIHLSDRIETQHQRHKENTVKDLAECADGVDTSSARMDKEAKAEDGCNEIPDNTASVDDQGQILSETIHDTNSTAVDTTSHSQSVGADDGISNGPEHAVINYEVRSKLENADIEENAGKAEKDQSVNRHEQEATGAVNSVGGYMDKEMRAADCTSTKESQITQAKTGHAITLQSVSTDLQKEPEHAHKTRADQTAEIDLDDRATSEQVSEVDSNSRLVKLPSCRHIFDARALDDYVESKFMSLGVPLLCPACPSPILENHCWRYQALLRRRQFHLQMEKKKLIDTAAVSAHRKDKIYRSFQEIRRSDYRQYTEQVKRLDKDLDCNLAFALTNQCKLLAVVNNVLDLCSLCPQHVKNTKRQLDCLRTVLEKPLQCLSVLRCLELTAETRRLSYLTLLSYGLHLSLEEQAQMTPDTFRNEDCIQELVRIIHMLEDKSHTCTGPAPVELNHIFSQCRDHFAEAWFTNVDKAVRLEILDAPLHQDLCDIRRPLKLIRRKPLKSESPGAVPQSAETFGAVPQSAESPGAVPQQSLLALCLSQQSPGAVPQSAKSPGAVSPSAESPGAVPQSAESPGAVPPSAKSRGAVSRSTESPLAYLPPSSPWRKSALPEKLFSASKPPLLKTRTHNASLKFSPKTSLKPPETKTLGKRGASQYSGVQRHRTLDIGPGVSVEHESSSDSEHGCDVESDSETETGFKFRLRKSNSEYDA